MEKELLGKCGFYCGSCPTYINKNCKGCFAAQFEEIGELRQIRRNERM